MKILILITCTLLVLLSVSCSNQAKENMKSEIQAVDKKVQKREGYCSPLDKMMNNKCKEDE
ncbi:hypothetical protein GW915_12115 [bacterium]|nr:hypothetical protein [bacterium]